MSLLGVSCAKTVWVSTGCPVFISTANCCFLLSGWLRLLFNMKPKEMAKIRLLAIWIDQGKALNSEKSL